MTSVQVSASKTYGVTIGSGILSELPRIIKETLGSPRLAVVTDDRVNALHGERLEAALNGVGHVKFVFKNGEASKNLTTYSRLLEFLAKNHITRSDAIIAFGGGVVGDTAGFAAASYLRGIRYIQVPTTLLAAVDSSVGGKTAVDLEAGKNLVGAFWQPSAVLCDYSLLSTLPDEIFADGMAEVIKTAVIRSETLFETLHSPVREKPESIEKIIAECVKIKRDIVNLDERDTGVRALLNFGHTAAHGIEKYSGYTVSHGSAVAIGMVIAARAAEKRGVCPIGTAGEISQLIRTHSLPENCGFTAEQLTNAALSDKKREGGEITLVLPKKIGECILEKIPVSSLGEFFAAGLSD